jgi:hypothetical protein
MPDSDRDWWHKFARRMDVVPAYVFLAIGSALGWQLTSQLSADRDEDQLQEIEDNRAILARVCEEIKVDRIALRTFVVELLDGRIAEDRPCGELP